MANTIKIRRSGIAGKIPALADLSIGELALNYADAKLYCKQVVNEVETIAEIGSAGADGVTSPATPLLMTPQVLNQDVTIPPSTNAAAIGPTFAIGAGKSLTVSANSNFKVI